MLLPPGGEILPVEGGLDSVTNKGSVKQKTSHVTEERPGRGAQPRR